MTIELHPQLKTDCYPLGFVNSSILLLHKNALVPWFILVPDTQENELFKLPPSQQLIVNQEINSIAQFSQQHFNAHKLNIATIGNIVPQLHVHIIVRHTDDFCWPKPVWGQPEFQEYEQGEITALTRALLNKKLLKN